jgi:hypothetical protein
MKSSSEVREAAKLAERERIINLLMDKEAEWRIAGLDHPANHLWAAIDIIEQGSK